MSAAIIRLFPDPILRKKTSPIKSYGAHLEVLIRKLEKAMRSQPSGIGIAAPQIGVAKRVALVDVSERVPDAGPLVLINPNIIGKWEVRSSREGCMSLPDYTADLKRYNKVRLRWQDKTGNHHEKDFEGIEAICIQHEIDHLNGVLFLDRVLYLKTDVFPRQSKPSRKKKT